MLNIEKNRLTNSFFIAVIILLFFITVLIKLNFFFNYFINIDSAFYVKWFTDLSLTNKIFSNNENTFYKSLLLHKDTLAHQLFRRYYNNSSEIYTILPTSINYLLMSIIGPGFKAFNIGSILVNSFIPIFLSLYFLKKYNFSDLKIIISLLFIFLIFLTNFNFFYWSPLGIHNYSFLSIVISIFIVDLYYKEKIFFNFKIILFAILLPCFTHKFNVPLIFLTFFFVIIYRRNYSKNFKNELIYLFSLFFLVVLPLIIGFYVNPKNLAFLSSFFSDENLSVQTNSSLFYSLINYELNIIKSAIPSLFQNYFYNLNFIGLFLAILSLFKSKNIILKFFLFANILIFIFLPVANFSLRLFNYQLLIILIIIIDYFLENLKSNKNFLKFSILLVFICFVSYSFYKTFFSKNLNVNEKNFINLYYKDNQKLKDLLFLLNKSYQLDPSNIVFGNYVAKDLFYSYFYEYKNDKLIDSFPAISSLYNNMNNLNYISSLDINFEKLRSTYYFNLVLKDKYKIKDPILNKFCEIRINIYNNCGEIKKLKLYLNEQPIKEIFYNGNFYYLFLYKIDPK